MGLDLGPFPARDVVDVTVDKGPSKLTGLGHFRPPLIEWFKKIFIIAFDQQNSGTTAQRPTTELYVGKSYFDTTLGYGIRWNGTNWVDGQGNTV